MLLGSQVVHSIYKPLADLDLLVEARTQEILKELEEDDQQRRGGSQD